MYSFMWRRNGIIALPNVNESRRWIIEVNNKKTNQSF